MSTEEYARYAEDIAEIEVGVAHLLEHLVETIERSKPTREIEKEAHEIADQARDLARLINKANFLDMHEHQKELEHVEAQTEDLMKQMPDAIVCDEQRKWATRLEEITANLHKLREAQSFLSSSQMQGRAQRNAHSTFLRMLKSTKARLDLAKDGILHKKHAKGHSTYLKLSKIKNAIGNVRGHLSDEGRRKSRNATVSHSKRVSEQMRMFFARELEGKLHIDFDVIKMTSKLTGREEEWAHNEINGHAMEMLFADTQMLGLVENARKRKASIIASFACRPDSGGLMAEIDAHERVISDDGIIARPYKTRIFL